MALHGRWVDVGEVGEAAEEGEDCARREASLVLSVWLRARGACVPSTIDTTPERDPVPSGEETGWSSETNRRCEFAGKLVSSTHEYCCGAAEKSERLTRKYLLHGVQ